MSSFANVSVVILAGGKGTRLQGLYPDIPKPLIPVAGRPFLYWLTRWIAWHGPHQFIYSTGYRADQIELWAADDSLLDVTRLCRRETEPLGTGGGLLNCLDACREWILVANGDGLVMGGIDPLLALRHTRSDGGLLGVAVPDTSRYGSLEIIDGDRLTAFREKIPGEGLINGGLYLFRKEVLLHHYRPGTSSLETDLFPAMISAGADLRVVRSNDAPFIDIGTPETVREAEAFVRKHVPDAGEA